MKHLVLIAALTLATPATAQDDPMRDGLEQLGEGSRLLLEGLLGEIAPLIEDLEGFGADMAPLMEDLGTQLGEAFEGLNAYHPPEILPNGDIILRKKQTAPEAEEPPAPMDDPVEL